MKEEIQAILLKLIVELKGKGWAVAPDWEITLKSDGHVPLAKAIPVTGNLDEDQWDDVVDTTIDLKLESRDEITYFPEYTIYANIHIDGANSSKDIAYKMDASVAFTDHDVRDQKKIGAAAKMIIRLIEDHVESEYSDYLDENAQSIRSYKLGGDPSGGDHDDDAD